jgi:hypothetical protein
MDAKDAIAKANIGFLCVVLYHRVAGAYWVGQPCPYFTLRALQARGDGHDVLNVVGL